MKDRRGDITVSVPVGGRLSDPRFDLRETIWSAVRTVAINAITLPVSWIGRVQFSADSRIQRIEVDPLPFEPGTAELTPDGRTRVTRVTAFLEQLRRSGSRSRRSCRHATSPRSSAERRRPASPDPRPRRKARPSRGPRSWSARSRPPRSRISGSVAWRPSGRVQAGRHRSRTIHRGGRGRARHGGDADRARGPGARGRAPVEGARDPPAARGPTQERE